MLQHSISMRRRSPGYEVRVVIGTGKTPNENDKRESPLKELQARLEMILPGSYKAKYNLNKSDLVVSIKADEARDAQSIVRKMEDHIKTASKGLK